MKLFFKTIFIMSIATLFACHSSRSQNNQSANCGELPRHTSFKNIKSEFKPFASEAIPQLLEKLDLCRIAPQNPDLTETCHFSKFKYMELTDPNYILIETNSTHYSGSGGHQIFIYKKEGKQFQLSTSYQGFVTAIIKKKKHLSDDILCSFYGDVEAKIILSLQDEKYMPTSLFSINGKKIAEKDCDSLRVKYIDDFQW